MIEEMSMSNKTIFAIQKARQLGLTKKEFEANYEVREDSHGFYCIKKEELIKREIQIEREMERAIWESQP